MMTKEEVIAAYGLNDGNDEFRYSKAVECSGMIDRPVSVCFQSLIKLEKAGLISLVKITVQ